MKSERSSRNMKVSTSSLSELRTLLIQTGGIKLVGEIVRKSAILVLTSAMKVRMAILQISGS